MRFIFSIFFLIAVFSTSAQTPAALQQHRFEYKTNLATEIHADTSEIHFYPFSKSFIITARVEILKDQPVFKMTTSSGKTKEAQKFAKITFRHKGRDMILYAYQLLKLKESKEYSDHIFVPFKDATTGKTTYAAGRYLDFTTADIKNSKLVIDFNKAYNPYCAFSDGYNCPIPPKENTLPLAVTAGEKKYTGIHISK